MEDLYTVSIIKTVLYVIGATLINTFSLPGPQLIMLGSLMILDLFAGISKQYIIDKKLLSIEKFKKGVIIKLATFVCLLAIGLVFTGYNDILGKEEALQYTKIILSILIMGELYSIVRHTYTIRTKKEIKDYDFFSLALMKIGSILAVVIEKALKIKFIEEKKQEENKQEENKQEENKQN